MSRIIMLIPLDKDVGLTTISLSLIYFFKTKIFDNNSQESILYFSCLNNSKNNTSLIINKYFSNIVDILDDINFSNKIFYSAEYLFLLDKMIENIYHKKSLYKLILIEGLKHHLNFHSEQINYDIAQNLSAEVVFLVNLKNDSSDSFKKKEQEIQLFLKRKKFKNVLGVIFNKVNSPFIKKEYNFIEKSIILKNEKENEKGFIDQKIISKNIFFPVLAFIPWNKNIKQIYLKSIFNFLNISFLNISKTDESIVQEIIIFDESVNNMIEKQYFNTLIIVSFSRINSFIKLFNLNFDRKKIIGIILTDVQLKSKKSIIDCCKCLIKRNINVAFTTKNTMMILCQLQKFNFNLTVQNKIYIDILQRYISSFFSNEFLKSVKKQDDYKIKYSPKEFCYNLRLLSRQNNKRIILPESYEIRILKAVVECQKNNIAQCVLLGDQQKIFHIANKNNIDLNSNTEIINPNLIRNKYVSRFLELRKKKHIDKIFAQKQLKDNIILATLMLENNEVDGLVCGSVNTTANTILPALQLIKTQDNTSLVSSIFLMLLPNKVLIYSDCAININPTSEELAEIAINSSNFLKIFKIKPRIAMLSYSTGYSGHGSTVEKVRQATCIIKNRQPNLIIDGPIQYDAAISKTVFKLKAPHSPIEGSANIFIFPDLNSGNIAYKAVQRSANILSIGPILQGLRKPVNDLSRGASVQDIIYTIALTSIQSL
ncbi:phosphate acetyltransferase [Buchnera aphidicola (Diuraphis noxia)]|uniref:Phosphate acetyltransferase n=1 Tax=Buchnera aphidicola subsp. Diuraphis noxia TaxID=118101 RepID=A0A1B2H851_BUCDN|nr:phosphate acetyltransferase [Buchnera aphidicola]ANZ22407.1 phosphate acetyltransferase [Buchnera aphidicola (Diuraphis noxia)]